MGKKRHASPRSRVQLQAKVNPSYAGLSTGFQDLPKAVQMPKSYRNYASQGFGGNPTIYKVIHYLIQNGAAIPPKLYTDATMDTEIAKHPLLDKLARPNPEQTGVDYREAVLGYFFVAANSYQYAIRKGTKGPPDELWTLEPDKVSILPSPIRGIVGYKFADFEQTIDPLNIGRMKSWNPNNPLYGMSPIEVGSILVDQQDAANKWNLALLQNFGKTSGVWTAPVAMAKTDRDNLEAKVNGKYGGYANAGKTPVLDAGLTFTPTAISPVEADWLKSMQRNDTALANLYDMPPQLIGDTSSSTYDNMDQAKVASYTEAIFPALDKLYALWNMWLVPMYPDLANGAYLYYDKTTVEVIQALIQAKMDSEAKRAVTSYMQGACTLNEARVLQGLPDIGKEGDVYRLGAVLVPADKLLDYAEQSMTEPAAPPMPQPEPIVALPAPTTPSQGDEKPTTPASKPDDATEGTPAKPQATQKQRMWHVERKGDNTQEPNYRLWGCKPTACGFCAPNDGQLVPIGDEFSNGCSSPDDCHRFCECDAYDLYIPDDANIDVTADLSADDRANLIALFAVGYIASRHARDVAERNARAAAQQQDDSDDENDDESKARDIMALQDRRRRREEFRQFREKTLG